MVPNAACVLYDLLALGLALSLALNLLYLRWAPSGLQPFLVAFWFVTSLFWKSSLLEHELSGKLHLTPSDWGWVHLNLWTLALVTVWVSRSAWWLSLWALNGFFSLLYWIDVLYYRYFDDLPGIYVMTAISQGPAAWPSAWALRKPVDVTLFFDLAIMLVALAIAVTPRLARARLPGGLVPSLLIACLAVNAINIHSMTSARARLLRLRFHNMAMVDELGLFHYHFYDIIQNVLSHWSNVIDPHFDEAALRRLVTDCHESVSERTPYLGSSKGRNLLMIQLESMESFVLDLKVQGKEVTPCLNKLQNECLVAALQDQSGEGRSSDGEFIYLNSLLPPGERPLVYAFPSNDYKAMPAVLNDAGYDTTYAVPYYGSFWNCRYMSERYGFKHHMLKDEFGEADEGDTIGWGLSDEGIFKKVIPELEKAPKPFFAYVVTMMGHHPYDEVDGLDPQLPLTGSLGNTTYLSRYLECCHRRDEQIGHIVARLKKSGLWDNTVVAMFGDHDARIPDDEMGLLYNRAYGKCDKIINDRVLLMIHSPGDSPHGRITGLVGQVDVDPTLLHLLGLDHASQAFTGLNLLSTRRRSFIVSKGEGGYALDATNGIRGEGGEMTSYTLKDRAVVNGTEDGSKLPLLELAEQQWKLYYDILRLNLVPWMLKQS